MIDVDGTRARPLYPLHGTPCVVCGYPAAAVVRTEDGTATAHHAPRGAERIRVCPHPPTGDPER